MPKLTIVEDAESPHLKPLALTRASFDLRVGIFSFKERIERMLGHEADFLQCRSDVEEVTAERHPRQTVNPEAMPADTLLVNGRWIPREGQLVDELADLLAGRESHSAGRIWMSGDDAVARIGREDAADTVDVGPVEMVSRSWQLVADPGQQVELDSPLLTNQFEPPAQWPDLTIVHEENVRIDGSAILGAGVILNASAGPIVIEQEAVIGDGAILRGPCHIGAKARVNMGARISRSSIGFNCRAGGEISKSILLAHANKWHDGYLGNSYIGEWCNLGADANTSNLRNDYGRISLYNEEVGEMEATDEQFLGTVMGDHSVCGINTMFNTGTVVGVCCNVFGPGYQPRHIRSFSWGGRDRMMRNRFERAVGAAQAMMARRDQTMSSAHHDLLKRIWAAGGSQT
jgi:UDP-N-acetylglucosamine diphosphorylase/glucosamine-1-phosphate N-acetyltransferase